jgi:hypothetical protein
MTNRTLDATQVQDGARPYPIDEHGKVRIARFDVPALAAALSANDTIGLCYLPMGRKLVLPNQSFITHSAFGASRTLDIGHVAYARRNQAQAAQEAEDPDAFADGLDVSGAGTGVAFGSVIDFEMFSQDRVLVFATVLGGTMPVGATLSGIITYVHE